MGAMAMAFTISVKLALIFVVAVPILSVVIYGIMMMTIPLYRKVQKKLEKIMLMTRENLSGVRVVRAFRTQEREKEDILSRKHKQLDAYADFVGKISALLNPVTYLIVNVATILIVWLGGKASLLRKSLLTGEVVALVNYMSQILLALVAFANLIITFTKALASAERINEVFALQSSMQSRNDKTRVGRKQ